eukprot:TRINITY_DN6066_c0_g1_i8.p1 TRINITY_DN6066_c0_g1~~TRINITY_DN6066_c0_g1_i8.p1  ORF type:complete len:235 (+),score=29.54 TRINITY_DN6066_c0_g1_i8:44-706(+)
MNPFQKKKHGSGEGLYQFIMILASLHFVSFANQHRFSSLDYFLGEFLVFINLMSLFLQKLHYWELVVISRRLLFSLIYSVVPYTSESLLFVLLFLILQASLWLQHRYRPFSSPLENWLEMMSLNVIYVSFFGGLLSTFLQVGGWLPSLIILMNSIVVGIYSVIIIVTTRYFRRGFRSVWYQLLALDITAKKDPLLPRDPTHDSVDFSDAPVELYIAAEES